MYPAKFEYYAPTTVNQALQLLSQHQDARILAGGHSLLPLMKLRLAQPPVLVDIGKIRDLNRIRTADGSVAIGALTTHAMIAASEDIRSRCAALPEAAALIGDLQVRNRGTIGGSVAHADPGADYPAVMLAADADIKVVGLKGERMIKSEDCFKGLMTTAVQPDEMIVEIRIPAPRQHSGSAYVKYPNPASRYAIVGVAAMLTLDNSGRVAQARIGVTGACDKAMRAQSAEATLRGKKLDDGSIQAAADQAANGMECLNDIHASSEYRAHLVRVYTARAIRAAAERAMKQ